MPRVALVTSVAIVAVLALQAVASAQTTCTVGSGETELLSATLTVGTDTDSNGNSIYGYSYSDTRGSLSPDTFTFRTATVAVDILQYIDASGESLQFEISVNGGTIPSDGLLGNNDFILCVGANTFSIDNPGISNSFSFANHGLSWSDGDSVAFKLKQAAPNNPATGAPTITGTATVGQTLMAVTTGIMDADGLSSVTYAYQWIRVDTDSTETDISGATSSTYTLVADDQGKTIKVKVSFTDDDGNSETLTSTTTAAVAANSAPTVANDIPDQTVRAGMTLTYPFPANTFSDSDGDTLTYTAAKADGTALPSWLTFSAGTRLFTGAPEAGDVGTVTVKVTASDGHGGAVSDEFDILVSNAANNAATGAVTITGTAQVGQTPTA